MAQAKTVPQMGMNTLDNIPAELKSAHSLIRWKYYLDKNGKACKSAVTASGFLCGHADPRAVVTLLQLEMEMFADPHIGPGISLGDGLQLSVNGTQGYLWCLDYDGFADLNGEVDDGVIKALAQIGGYVEMSPSGTGFKQFFVSDKKPTTKFKIPFGPSAFADANPEVRKYAHREIEVFAKGYFMALTGNLFSTNYGKLKFVPEAEYDAYLQWLRAWAINTGGADSALQKASTPALASPTHNTTLTLPLQPAYSKLTPASLQLVLAYIETEDEQIWCDVANALARAYGEEGRAYFISYSAGDYAGIRSSKYDPKVCSDRYDRALKELGSRVTGYGVMNLIKLAGATPGWISPALEYESNVSLLTNLRGNLFGDTLGLGAQGLTPTLITTTTATTLINLSDVANGKRFADSYRGSLLYVAGLAAWLEFVEQVGWTYPAQLREEQAAKEILQLMAQEAGNAFAANPDSPHTKRIMAEVTRTSRAHNVRAMVEMAKSEPGMSVAAGNLDADNFVLGVQNGVVNLKTGQLMPVTPALMVTKRCAVNFDPTADCPRFKQFLKEVIPEKEERDFLCRWFGYTLTGDVTSQVLLFIKGSGSNGKSLIMELISWLMADYSRKIETEMLMRQHRSTQGPSPDLAGLLGKRLVFCNETTEGQRLDDARVKELTGGDTITGRVPYAKSAVEFRPTHKLVISGNHEPIISDDGYGLWRRIVLFEFKVTFTAETADMGLLGTLKAEGAGILNLLLESLADWHNGGLQVPESLKKSSQVYRDEQDIVGGFIDEDCDIGPNYTASKTSLYSNYQLWCGQNGHFPLSANRFSRKLKDRGYTTQADHKTLKGLRRKPVVFAPSNRL